MTDPALVGRLRAALDGIARRIEPCPPPRAHDLGDDLCPCLTGSTWPCPTTEAAWLARGLDRDTEVRRALDGLPRDHDLGLDAW
jgi:hypothetical protein